MKIHRIVLRNFRATTEREVDFALTGITVIEGANEAGKTSIADALTMLLDEPDTSKKAPVLAVQPKGRDVGAEVEAAISSGRYRFVYAKRWHRKPMTSLTIEAPVREQLTGRAAHDRVRQILDETLDAGLWAALRMDQRMLPVQAALGGNPSLIAALDAASGGSLGTETESSLYERVEAEYVRHWTAATGRPTGAYRDAIERLAEAQRSFDEADRELASVQADVDRHEQVSRDLARLGERLPAHEERARELAEKWAQVEARRTRIERFDSAVVIAEQHREQAARAVEERSRLVQAASGAANLSEELDRSAAALAPGRASAESRRDELRIHRQAARALLTAAEEAERLAVADAAFRRDELDVALMSERYEQATAAEGEIAAADAVLSGACIDDELMASIDAAQLRVVRARAIAESSAATLTINAARDLDIVVAGEPTSLSAGETTEQALTGDTTIEVSGLVSIAFTPGGDAAERSAELAEAESALGSLLVRIGVSDVTGARELQARHRDAQRRRTTAEQARKLALRDLSIDELSRRVSELQERVAKYTAERDSELPLPPDLDAATRALDDARAAARAARESLTRCEADFEAAVEAVKTLHADAEVAIARARDAGVAREATTTELATARQAAPDEELAAALRRADNALVDARAVRATEVAALEQRDVVALEAACAGARDALERLREDLRRCEHEIVGLEARIDAAGGRGLFDRHAAATNALAAAERLHRGCAHRALAAQRLFEVLDKHREQAKRDYVAPYRDRLETLGRIVFGASFAVELDEDLCVVSRTLDGITVPFNELSSGAREQLCIIGRLACAALIAGDGVPVVVDDALGHSDPDRLERLGAVFTAASRDAQVIVLTCVPDRYRSVVAARVVTLTPERAPVVPLPATPDDRHEAADTLAG